MTLNVRRPLSISGFADIHDDCPECGESPGREPVEVAFHGVADAKLWTIVVVDDTSVAHLIGAFSSPQEAEEWAVGHVHAKDGPAWTVAPIRSTPTN